MYEVFLFFGEKSLVNAEVGDITKSRQDAIVNDANSCGVMSYGVSALICNRGGVEIQDEAKGFCRKNKNIELGSCFSTQSGKLKRYGTETIYHAVISRTPKDLASIHFVKKVLNEVLATAVNDGIESIAIPSIGLGGGLDKTVVAMEMARIAKNFCNKIDIRIIDVDKEFIENVRKNLLKGN